MTGLTGSSILIGRKLESVQMEICNLLFFFSESLVLKEKKAGKEGREGREGGGGRGWGGNEGTIFNSHLKKLGYVKDINRHGIFFCLSFL